MTEGQRTSPQPVLGKRPPPSEDDRIPQPTAIYHPFMDQVDTQPNYTLFNSPRNDHVHAMVGAERHASPSPSSSALSSVETSTIDVGQGQATQSSTAGPPAKRRKLTVAEKEEQARVKEVKRREKAERQAKREEEKAVKEEEKRVKDEEKRNRNEEKEEKRREKELEKQRAEEEKAKKERVSHVLFSGLESADSQQVPDEAGCLLCQTSDSEAQGYSSNAEDYERSVCCEWRDS